MVHENGGDANMSDYKGCTPLIIAVGGYHSSDAQITEYLLEKGRAHVNVRNNDGCTPLHNALMEGNKGTRFL